ncbi:MAG TPA: hypothetical protein VG407_17545 [Caulobacteraceae bacterium]|nr:hypothetical protein [Caulobacteraceae bacterium]
MPKPPAVTATPRHADGRFGAGNPGKPPGSRNKISRRLAVAILEDFEDHQEEIFERLRHSWLPVYTRLVSGLLPKSVEMTLPDLSACTEAEAKGKVLAVREVLHLIDCGQATLEHLGEVLMGENDPWAD